MRALFVLMALGLLACGCDGAQRMMDDAQRPNSTPPAHFNEAIWSK